MQGEKKHTQGIKLEIKIKPQGVCSVYSSCVCVCVCLYMTLYMYIYPSGDWSAQNVERSQLKLDRNPRNRAKCIPKSSQLRPPLKIAIQLKNISIF